MNKEIKALAQYFLHNGELFRRGDSYVEFLNSVRPYIFKTPKTVEPIYILLVAKILAAKIELAGQKAIHIVGIATQGIPLSTAVFQKISEKTEHKHVHSVVNPFNNSSFKLGECRLPIILIDNSIKSGRTLENVVLSLRAEGQEVIQAHTVFDHFQSREGRTWFQEIGETLAVEIITALSIIDIRDVLDSVGKKELCAKVCEYLDVERKIDFTHSDNRDTDNLLVDLRKTQFNGLSNTELRNPVSNEHRI